jgi:hypothetical protein
MRASMCILSIDLNLQVTEPRDEAGPALARPLGPLSRSSPSLSLSFVASTVSSLPPASPTQHHSSRHHPNHLLPPTATLRARQYFDRATTDLTSDHCHCHLTANSQQAASSLTTASSQQIISLTHRSPTLRTSIIN